MENLVTNPDLWKQIQEFYETKFNIKPELLDLYIDYDILKLCASGSSNKSIASFLSLPEEDEIYTPIANTIERYFGFGGWISDLDCSPYSLYKKLNKGSDVDFEEFTKALNNNFISDPNMDIASVLNICRIMYHLERVIDENWI